jgi:hypothetical protein
VSELRTCSSLAEAAQRFAALFADGFDSVVLARAFAVLPYEVLPPREGEFATALSGEPLQPKTPVLALLGTRGRLPAWSARAASAGHLAIPLSSSRSVRQAPMIAKLLDDFQINPQVLDSGRPIASRSMLVGRSATFFVEDAGSSTDKEGRFVIPARDFVEAHGVQSVFGMGGAYLDGTVVAGIIFCSERLERPVAERFTSLLDAFKIATADFVRSRLLF